MLEQWNRSNLSSLDDRVCLTSQSVYLARSYFSPILREISLPHTCQRPFRDGHALEGGFIRITRRCTRSSRTDEWMRLYHRQTRCLEHCNRSNLFSLDDHVYLTSQNIYYPRSNFSPIFSEISVFHTHQRPLPDHHRCNGSDPWATSRRASTSMNWTKIGLIGLSLVQPSRRK